MKNKNINKYCLTSSYANSNISIMNENWKNDFIYLVRYLYRLIDKDFNNRLTEYGLTAHQARILFFLERKTCEGVEVHQNDIEKQFHLSKSSVSGLVKRMEKKNLIDIEKQFPYAIIKIGDKGKEILSNLKKHRDEAIQELLKDVSKEDEKQAKETLLKLINNMKGGSDDA